jgi:hypothetical protein
MAKTNNHYNFKLKLVLKIYTSKNVKLKMKSILQEAVIAKRIKRISRTRIEI